MSDPVGVREIAARVGLSEIAVRKWVSRHGPDTRSSTPFPPARWEVSGRDAYDWAEVRQWLADTGRLVTTSSYNTTTGQWEKSDSAEPDTPPEVGKKISGTLAGVPADLWWTTYDDGRWYLQLDNNARGGDMRTAAHMVQLLQDAGLYTRPAELAAARALVCGETIEVL